MVEYRLAKARVAGSNPVSRSQSVRENLEFVRVFFFAPTENRQCPLTLPTVSMVLQESGGIKGI